MSVKQATNHLKQVQVTSFCYINTELCFANILYLNVIFYLHTTYIRCTRTYVIFLSTCT